MYLSRHYLEGGEHILCFLHPVPVVAGPLCQPIHEGKSLDRVWLMQLSGDRWRSIGEYGPTSLRHLVVRWGQYSCWQPERAGVFPLSTQWVSTLAMHTWLINQLSSFSFFIHSMAASWICILKTWHPCLSPGLNSWQQNAQVCRQVRYHLRHWGWLSFLYILSLFYGTDIVFPFGFVFGICINFILSSKWGLKKCILDYDSK